MKKMLLLLIPVCFMLSGCSSHKVYTINTDKSKAGNFLEAFVITNGFHLAYADKYQGIYKVETDNTDLGSGIYAGMQKTLTSGFGIRMKEISPDCTVIISDSFGFGMNGHYYNKTKRFIKRLKEEGYTIEKGQKCDNI